jgi:hypothetical protein
VCRLFLVAVAGCSYWIGQLALGVWRWTLEEARGNVETVANIMDGEVEE